MKDSTQCGHSLPCLFGQGRCPVRKGPSTTSLHLKVCYTERVCVKFSFCQQQDLEKEYPVLLNNWLGGISMVTEHDTLGTMKDERGARSLSPFPSSLLPFLSPPPPPLSSSLSLSICLSLCLPTFFFFISHVDIREQLYELLSFHISMGSGVELHATH